MNEHLYHLEQTTSIYSNSSDHVYRPSTNHTAPYQLGVSLVIGTWAILLFSVLRVRYPKIYVANLNQVNSNYLHSCSRYNLPRIPLTLFGWIPVLFRINDDQVLEHAGLDALVFLRFFKMCIRILTTCLVFAITIISPIRFYYTGKVDQDYPSDDEPSVLDLPTVGYFGQNFKQFYWTYTVFTYTFTLVVAYFLFRESVHIIKIRQEYLGRQNSITDRTIKISGIPAILRDEQDLKRQIEGLGIAKVDSVLVVKEWGRLNELFRRRRKILYTLEAYWAKYFARLGIQDTDQLLACNLQQTLGSSYDLPFTDDPTSQRDSSTASYPSSVLHRIEAAISGDSDASQDDEARRPLIRLGPLGWCGARVDAISHLTTKLGIIDHEIKRARSKEYPPSSTAFVTLRATAQAQMLAQAVLDPKINHLITTLAPAPHDIIWDNVCLSRRERNTRIFFVTLLIGLMSILMVFPVRYLANLLNVKSITRIWPNLGHFLRRNGWAAQIVTGLLPPYIFAILNTVMPFFCIWLSNRQGYTSHSDVEISTVSKNFFYIFVNLFLVFTLFGTAILSDTSKIAYQLAQSLRDLLLFYVDLIILQGIGMFPYKLLLLGDLVKYLFSKLFWCETPRDQLRLYKPPVFNFGLNLPQPILILIISVVYSVMSSKILTAGLLYFLMGYVVCKYQLLYACVHPPHSTGKVWPLIFRRVILGLWIFQITMVGTLALESAYICAFFLVPLPILTFLLLWNFEKSYIPLLIFIALRSIEDEQIVDLLDTENLFPHSNPKTLDERREFHTKYDFPNLVSELQGPMIASDGQTVLRINHDGLEFQKL